MLREPLVDGHGRRIADLRVSVTDRCNFRCQYCMPAEGLTWLDRDQVLTFEEIERLVALLAEMGITDLRLTGGEPLVRRDFPVLAGMLARVPGLKDLSLTTNGYLLQRDARALADAGVRRINVSIDSLQRDRFFEMTRRDSLPQVLAGLEAVAAIPELRPIKVNAVALRGFTEQEAIPFARFARERDFEVRFIEFMPLDGDQRWTLGSGADRRGAAPDHPRRPPAGGAAARAVGDRARLPLRRWRRADRVHQPGVRAVLLGLQPHPPDRRGQAAHLPVLAARDRPARAPARRAPRTTTSSRSCATPSGARSSSTGWERRAFASPRAA
ncbi:MAG: radical SAM protein [Thermoleophilaceae bacterium]